MNIELEKLKRDLKCTNLCAAKYHVITAQLMEAKTKEARMIVIFDLSFCRKDCALCVVYNTDELECDGCPVKAKTKRRFCVGSPFRPSSNAEIKSISTIHGQCLWAHNDDNAWAFNRAYTHLTRRCEKEAAFLTALAAELQTKITQYTKPCLRN